MSDNALETEGDIAADYLEGLLDIIDVDGDIEMDVENDRAMVAIVGGEDLDDLVGDGGEVLDALQELTRLAIMRETGHRSRMMLDIAGFRAALREQLTAQGEQAVAEARRTGTAVPLPPMTPFERKVVHDAVAAAGLVSESSGEEPNRYVVVLPSFHVERLARYQQVLATDGVTWGLIGPREVDRLWERHIDNCLAVTQDDECLPQGATVLDVGTGAGLPGVVWALARPDLRITLLEPLERRLRFLEKVVADLDLPVAIVRARIQDVDLRADRVTARAVAATATLLPWCAPHVSPGGRIVLLKGKRAQGELEVADPWLRRHRWTAEVRMVGDPPRTRVIVAQRQEGR